MTEKPTLRMLICGGRNYRFTVADIAFLNTYRDAYNVVEVVHGGASGADREADDWAKFHDLKVRVFQADWDWWRTVRGKNPAGVLRNVDMACWLKKFHGWGEAVIVIAFPGGTGTAHMVSTAQRSGLPVVIAADEIKKQEESNA